MALTIKNFVIESLKTFYERLGTRFQETLVSGVNLKTVAGETLLGSGNVVIDWEDLSGVPSVFPAETHNHDDVYVKLDAGQAEQTIKNTISNISNGSIEIWRAISGGYPMIGFATGTTKTKLGLLGFGTTANEPILRTTGGVDYKLWHAGNLTPKTITLSTSAQTYITAGSTNYTLQMPSTDPYTSARTPSAHDHERIKPTRHDSDDPAPNTKGAYLTFQFSYIGGKWWNVLNMRSYTDMKYVSAELLTPANNPGADTGYSGNMMWRQGRNSTWLDMRTILDSANYTDYTVQKDGTGATGTWGIDISGNAATATTATNSDKVDEHHAMSAGSLLYKYAVTATIPASSVSGDFWYATITFARSYVRELTRSMLDACYSNRQGQVYLNTYEYNGAWYAFTTNYNGSNIKGIAHKSQNNPIYYVKLAKPTTYNNTVPDGTITVYSPYNCTITVSATAPSGVTFTDLTTPGFTNLKASSASSADSAITATYASNVGSAGTAGTNYVTAAKVIATCNWYDTMTGSDTDAVINRWSEIVAFVANFEETPDLATFLSNNYLALSGGTMTGPIKWTDSTALPEQQSPQYFVCIDAFNSGGTTKWASKANTLKALTGLTSTAVGDSDEPVYWDGSKFIKAGAYPTKASWNYDDVYPKKYSYSLPPQKCVKITYSSQAPVIISAGRSNGNSEFLLAGLGYGADGWTRNQFRCLIPSASFTWKLSATSCTVELYHNNANSGNAVVTVITTGSITFTEVDALSGDADTKRFACYDELTWDNIANKPATATGYGYIGTTAVQANSAAQNLTGINDSTFSGVMNITGRQSYAEGIRIHDYSGISSIWFRAVNADSYDAGMIGITGSSAGLRFRLPASATGTSPTDYVTIAYGGATTVAGTFTASNKVYFTGLGEGTSDVTADTEILTSYAGTSGFANTTGAGQVYRRQASKLYNYIKTAASGDWTINSAKVKTIKSTTNATYYLTFVDSNNTTATAETVYTSANITFNPSTSNLAVTTAANQNMAFKEVRTGGASVSMGVGSGNKNHGVYSNSLSKWLIYADSSDTTNKKVYVDGTIIPTSSGTALTTSNYSTTLNSVYVRLNPGAAEQTIESSIGTYAKGIVEFYRSSGDHIAFITFSNKANNAKRVLGSIGFYSGGVGKLQYRSADAKFYDIVNGSNITTYVACASSTVTLSTSEQTLLTVKSGESGSLSSSTIKVKLPATSPYSYSFDDITSKPTWITWEETSSTATYSLSNATWTQTITLPTTAGSYILKLVSGNSTLTGVFSIGASDNAKDEISLHLHGNGPRLYARTNGTKLELSRNIATATNTSVTITYRRMI